MALALWWPAIAITLATLIAIVGVGVRRPTARARHVRTIRSSSGPKSRKCYEQGAIGSLERRVCVWSEGYQLRQQCCPYGPTCQPAGQEYPGM